MGVKDQIHESAEYQALTGQNSQNGQQSGGQPSQTQGGTVGDSLAPVLNWEKTDVEFWTQVVQVFLLLLILRELRNGGV